MDNTPDAFDRALFICVWLLLLIGSGLGALAIHEMEVREARRAACELSPKAGQSPARCLEVR